MKIYFIRHGQTDWNLKFKIQGLSDIALNQMGRSQAHETAQYIEKQQIVFEKIWSSPLKRAKETAQILGDHNNTDIVLSDELKEFDFGDWEGKITSEIEEQKLFKNWYKQSFFCAAPRGETFCQMQTRLQFFLDKSLILKSKKPVAVVAHQGTLVALKSLITKKQEIKTLDSYRQANFEFDIMNIDTLKIQRVNIGLTQSKK